jgi:GT2 family glycosyltransferase
MGKNLNASIVLYNPDFPKIAGLINVLKTSNSINHIYLIDNSPTSSVYFKNTNVEYIFQGKNIGYGPGHNIAFKKSMADDVKYHLVLNPDIFLESNVLDTLISCLEQKEDIGLIMPQIRNEDETIQLLPKLLPSPLDMIIRISSLLKRIAKKRSKLYVLEDYQNEEINVPIISGCFGIFRIESLKTVGLYDNKFFMYFEDFDLSRRIHRVYKTVYYPIVSVVHFHERGAAKKFKLFITFLKSAVIYFNKYGWLFDRERKQINNACLSQIR